MRDYVLSLASLEADLNAVGGKGAALARMAAAGLPVPEGFYLTTAAYRTFVAANHLEAMIRVALDAVDVDQPSTLDRASEQIRRDFDRQRFRPKSPGPWPKPTLLWKVPRLW